jgi:hypothetical protein
LDLRGRLLVRFQDDFVDDRIDSHAAAGGTGETGREQKNGCRAGESSDGHDWLLS